MFSNIIDLLNSLRISLGIFIFFLKTILFLYRVSWKFKILRPLLDYSNLKKSIDDIIKQRKSTYAKADVKIKVYKTNKKNIANKIIKFLWRKYM